MPTAWMAECCPPHPCTSAAERWARARRCQEYYGARVHRWQRALGCYRVNGVVDVDDLVVVKGAQHVEHAIDPLDVGKERVAQTGAFGRTLDKTYTTGGSTPHHVGMSMRE